MFFYLIYICIDGCYSYNVDYVTDSCAKVYEMDGFVQPHLDGTDNLHVSIQHL